MGFVEKEKVSGRSLAAPCPPKALGEPQPSVRAKHPTRSCAGPPQAISRPGRTGTSHSPSWEVLLPESSHGAPRASGRQARAGHGSPEARELEEASLDLAISSRSGPRPPPGFGKGDRCVRPTEFSVGKEGAVRSGGWAAEGSHLSASSIAPGPRGPGSGKGVSKGVLWLTPTSLPRFLCLCAPLPPRKPTAKRPTTGSTIGSSFSTATVSVHRVASGRHIEASSESRGPGGTGRAGHAPAPTPSSCHFPGPGGVRALALAPVSPKEVFPPGVPRGRLGPAHLEPDVAPQPWGPPARSLSRAWKGLPWTLRPERFQPRGHPHRASKRSGGPVARWGPCPSSGGRRWGLPESA